MKNQLHAYFEDVKEIEIMEDILTSYSHAKVYKICTYKNIRILFEFFISYNKDNYLSNFRGDQKERYGQALDELLKIFRRNDS